MCKRIPTLNGNSLDLIIDYFTCIIVPVAFIDRFNVLPDNTIAPTGFTILFVSALWMARTDQETPDGWFRGFPAEWNVIIPTLFLIDTSRWFNLAVCVGLCALTLSRVKLPHPVSVREQRPIALAFMFLWLGSMTWLAIAQRHITWLQIMLVVTPMWTVWQVLNRVADPESGACREWSPGLIASVTRNGRWSLPSLGKSSALTARTVWLTSASWSNGRPPLVLTGRRRPTA